jgi:hypothetical protein
VGAESKEPDPDSNRVTATDSGSLDPMDLSNLLDNSGILWSAETGDTRQCTVLFLDNASAAVPAHCVYSVNLSNLRLSWLSGGAVETTTVDSVWINPRFSHETGAHDLALLTTKTLPEGRGLRVSTEHDAHPGAYLSFGGEPWSSADLSDPAAFIEEALESSEASQGLCQSRPAPDSSMICIPSAHVCVGDSGMPLFTKTGELIGLLSSGEGVGWRSPCETGDAHFTSLVGVQAPSEATATNLLVASMVIVLMVAAAALLASLLVRLRRGVEVGDAPS